MGVWYSGDRVIGDKEGMMNSASDIERVWEIVEENGVGEGLEEFIREEFENHSVFVERYKKEKTTEIKIKGSRVSATFYYGGVVDE